MQFDSYIVSDTKTAFSVPIFDKTNIKIKNNKSFKRFAFTLAETLITLTIIGVVAALTIPNLLNKYTKHTYVVGLKKAYSILQEGSKMAPLNNGESAGGTDWLANCTGFNPSFEKCTRTAKAMTAHLKTNNKCKPLNWGKIQNSGCTNQSRYANLMTPNTSPILLENNMLFFWIAGEDKLKYIYVDINGDKAPNKDGRDTFIFYQTTEQVGNIPAGTVFPCGGKQLEEYIKLYRNQTDAPEMYWKTKTNCNSNSFIDDCTCVYTGRILEEDAMNY